MSGVVVAGDDARSVALADGLELEGIRVHAVIGTAALSGMRWADVDAVVLPATRRVLTADLVTACDRAAVRIVPLGGDEPRLLARFGLPSALPADADAAEIAALLRQDSPALAELEPQPANRVITVWGPHGAPGRSTVAVQLATELARAPGRCALVDADSVAPAVSLLLGLGDEAPGLAAACRRAGMGGLDAAELTRLAITAETAGGPVEVLAGLNRPGRWPELSADRLRSALASCREWAANTVVDVAAALDADDEVSTDLEGPRRHAATVAALQEADLILAVASADPLGIARFVREHAEVRHLIGDTPIRVVVNRVRPGPLGIDARGQVRRTLERFAGIRDIRFLPHDQRAADAALLHARPIADVTPRSPLASACRQLADGLLEGERAPRTATAGTRRGSSRAARWLLRAPGARAASPPGSDPVSAG